MEKSTIILSVVSSVLASTGLWGMIARMVEKRTCRDDVHAKMLIGLAHDRICYLGEKYLERGWVTKDEFENLHDYLYKPYEALGGNGTAEKIMREVGVLPLHDRKDQMGNHENKR